MSTKVTYQEIMTGVWGRNGRQRPVKSDAGCQPRSGGAKITLVKVCKKDALARIVAQQNKGN